MVSKTAEVFSPVLLYAYMLCPVDHRKHIFRFVAIASVAASFNLVHARSKKYVEHPFLDGIAATSHAVGGPAKETAHKVYLLKIIAPVATSVVKITWRLIVTNSRVYSKFRSALLNCRHLLQHLGKTGCSR